MNWSKSNFKLYFRNKNEDESKML